ncbi:MAG: RecQ family ATP-dependent DNA helicase, partial [Saprospiraceae bacterium]|nr:RecQ family ATP-dependent DNA helicase [Saprospiraceae bacterium]
MSSPEKILHDVFGYAKFRHDQRAIIQTVLDGHDALVIMPTGGGKSICYQVPALMGEGITLVISPLIALMNDQVAALLELGIEAATIHSGLDAGQRAAIAQKLSEGKLKLLYVAPETLLADRFLAFVRKLTIDLIAIDEAHCVSIWGNDFRPHYVNLAVMKQHFPTTPVLALTATADRATQTDISNQLGLSSPRLFLASFERANIQVESRPGQNRLAQIHRFIGSRFGEAGIVYCLSRKSTETLASKLQSKGIRAKAYHAGLAAADRDSIQREFQSDDLDVICATIAFGMG